MCYTHLYAYFSTFCISLYIDKGCHGCDHMVVEYTTTLYLCNQCLSPLTLWAWIPLRRGVLNTTLCDKVFQWLTAGRWFSPGTTVSSSNKTDRHHITEILLEVVLSMINQSKPLYIDCCWVFIIKICHDLWYMYIWLF